MPTPALTKCFILNPNERQPVMKKIYIALAVLATALLVSCEREQSFNGLRPLGKNEIAFVLDGVSTKSTDASSSAVAGVSISLGKVVNGEALFLEETVEELNIGPETKGRPAYTEYVGSLYPEMGVYCAYNEEDVVFGPEDGEMYAREENYGEPKDTTLSTANKNKGWRYLHSYDSSPWPDQDTPVDFYLRMPAQMFGASNLAYSEQKIAFDFEPLPTAAEQDDILFSYTSLSQSRHQEYSPKGAPVVMYHALTGIKFRTGHENDTDTKTVITKVKFTGLKGTGHCVFNPSASGDKFAWTPGTSTAYSYSQTFANPTYDTTLSDLSDNPDGSITYDPADAKFGSTWYGAAYDKNLNNADGSLTFWLIPQAMTNTVKLEVTFLVKTKDTPEGRPITHVIDFGKELAAKNVVWKAGQLRTYTLKPYDVDVDIFDSIQGLTKSDLHVTNTGNVDEFVRMMLVGNWYDSDGNILMGYKYPSDATEFETGDDINTMANPWYREDPEWSGYFDITFQNGRPNAAAGNKWIFGTGSYFYYPDAIGPGEKLHNSTSSTTALFQSYSLPESAIPTIWIPSTESDQRVPAQGVHLVMEVVIQAISTINPDTGEPYEDGETKAWQQAWSKVTGREIKPKS